MIKYLGSKRLLVPVLTQIAAASQATTAVDLFTGTTRVAQAFKRLGLEVTASDVATYSGVLSDCYIATDARAVDRERLAALVDQLNALPGRPGYVTDVFCHQARYFQPKNGERIDAIRDHIEATLVGDPLYPVALTALIDAADRVDSTVGLQMAYLKKWSKRSHNDLRLAIPDLLDGIGHTVVGDVTTTIDQLPPVDLMYLDPPYNQHRYFTNYHVWETLVRWDHPDSYGVARKRIDARDPATHSPFNRRQEMPSALADVLARAKAELLVVSYNDESWITPVEMVTMLRDAGRAHIATLAFDSPRYVGAQIGIHNRAGEKVGQVGKLRNVEYVFLAGDADRVAACEAAVNSAAVAPEDGHEGPPGRSASASDRPPQTS